MSLLSEALNIEDSEWMDQAECRGVPYPDIFVPDLPGGKNNVERSLDIKAAKSYCVVCPVIGECLAEGISTDAIGVWGGVYFHEDVEKRRVAQEEARSS